MSRVVLPPGGSLAAFGVACTASVRVDGRTFTLAEPLARAGRSGSEGSGSPSAPSRGAAPTNSTANSTFGTIESSSSTSSVCDGSVSEMRSRCTTPCRRTVNTPSAGVKGATTNTVALSPGRYSFSSGITMTLSASSDRSVGADPPSTQVRSADSFLRPWPSVTTAVTW